MTPPHPKTNELARSFARHVTFTLGPHLPEINRRNRVETRMDCATHDFFPAYILMQRAWRDTGLAPISARGYRARWQADLWNAAWAVAARAGFDLERIKP